MALECASALLGVQTAAAMLQPSVIGALASLVVPQLPALRARYEPSASVTSAIDASAWRAVVTLMRALDARHAELLDACVAAALQV
jgi:hypothetical protein